MSTGRFGLILVSALLLSSAAFPARGSGSEIAGTLTASDEDQVRVMKADGNELVVLLSDATRYQDAHGAPLHERPQVGDRVVIDVAGGWTGVLATRVRIWPAEKAATQPVSPRPGR